MKSYTVTIEETVVGSVEISAESEDEAVRVASDMYNSGNIVLEPGELIDVKFNVAVNEPKKHTLIRGVAYTKGDDIYFNNETFVNNLILVDSTLPSIFANMLKKCIEGEDSSISNLTQKCAEENICNIKSKYFVLSYYIKKITDFLYSALHGMGCNNTWDGECRTKSVYMLDNGVTFSMYELKRMLDYLYENACFEIVDKVAIGERTKYTWQICL